MIDSRIMMAAFARGWSLEQIAFAAGCTRQNIQQRIARFEQQHGPIDRDGITTKRTNRGNLRSHKCPVCGTTWWGAPRINGGRSVEHFCSMKCQIQSRRTVSDEDIERAIDLRWAGKPWNSISRKLGHSQQALQNHIWKHLYKIGMLNTETVESIWMRGGKYGWRWLERNTGLVCTESGAVLHKNRRGGNAWGVRQGNRFHENEVSDYWAK